MSGKKSLAQLKASVREVRKAESDAENRYYEASDVADSAEILYNRAKEATKLAQEALQKAKERGKKK